MKRLELLKKEQETVRQLKTLCFDLKEKVDDYYFKEIMAIEDFGAPNPEYVDQEEKDIKELMELIRKINDKT